MPTVLTRSPNGTPRRAIGPGEGLPISYASFGGSGRGCPLLRASNDVHAASKFARSLSRDGG